MDEMFKKGMTKILAVAVAVSAALALVAGPVSAQHHPSWNQSYGQDQRVVDHQKTAMGFSRMFSGVGEWYNRNYEGGFPWGECILGYICCFIKIASIMDAADGVDNEEWRFNFWVSPHEAYAETGK